MHSPAQIMAESVSLDPPVDLQVAVSAVPPMYVLQNQLQQECQRQHSNLRHQVRMTLCILLILICGCPDTANLPAAELLLLLSVLAHYLCTATAMHR